MEKRILDTDILIDHLRGYLPAKGYMEQFEFGNFKGYITTVSILELYAGKKIKELPKMMGVERLIGMLEKVDLSVEIAKKAGEIVRLYECVIPDAIVAATASHNGAKIVTRNRKHYSKIKEVEIEVPYF